MKKDKNYICIDPGTEKSGFVVIDKDCNVLSFDSAADNHTLLSSLKLGTELYLYDGNQLLIEMVASYGMPVGKTTFETCVWIGRFLEAFGVKEVKDEFVYRKDVKMHLCNSMRAKDAHVRQAILDRYPSTGGGKTPQIGTKKEPGPLYGISSHCFSALSLGLTHLKK